MNLDSGFVSVRDWRRVPGDISSAAGSPGGDEPGHRLTMWFRLGCTKTGPEPPYARYEADGVGEFPDPLLSAMGRTARFQPVRIIFPSHRVSVVVWHRNLSGPVFRKVVIVVRPITEHNRAFALFGADGQISVAPSIATHQEHRPIGAGRHYPDTRPASCRRCDNALVL